MENGQSAMRISADAMVALVVAEAEARELAGMPPLRELNTAFEPSGSFLRRMQKLLRRAKTARRGKKLWKAARRALLCGAAMLALLCGGMMQVEAVREAVISTLIEWKSQYAEFRFQNEGGPGAALPQTIELTYLPEGFAAQDIYCADELFSAIYNNGLKGNEYRYFSVEISVPNESHWLRIDNEHTSYYSIQFDGHDAVWCAADKGINMLSWTDDGLIWFVEGSIDLAELIRIVEGIQM